MRRVLPWAVLAGWVALLLAVGAAIGQAAEERELSQSVKRLILGNNLKGELLLCTEGSMEGVMDGCTSLDDLRRMHRGVRKVEP